MPRIVALITPSHAVIILHPGILGLSANMVPNKPAANVFNNIPRNPPFCSFALFSIVSLTTPFINTPNSLRDLTIS